MRLLSAATPARLAGAVLCVVWLFHTTLVDRLDITKLAIGLVAATAVLILVGLRRTDRERLSLDGLALLGVCLAAGSLFSREIVAARVEGWAPWLVAVVLFVIVRSDCHRRVGGVIAFTVAVLTLIGFVQACGGDWFIAELNAFEGRPVMGTLGNPGLYGACLAAALPFVLMCSRRPSFAILSLCVVAAVILCGARTAWVMLLPGVVAAGLSIPKARVVSIIGAGVLLATVVGLASPDSDLENRISDLGDRGGTAAGRLYLWNVNWELAKDAGLLGGGPETFRRRWPRAQAEFLAQHPEDIHFHSDLRHAHADAVEVLVDWGWVGLIIASILLFRLLLTRSPPTVEDPDPADSDDGKAPSQKLFLERRAAQACMLSLLLGGLAFPVLFQPPTLFLAAIAVGVLAGPPKKRSTSYARVAAIIGIALTFFWVGQRTISEVVRTYGLRAEVAGHLDEARTNYCFAADLDPRNPLALVMCARSLIVVDSEHALRLADAAVRHLPTAPVYAIRATAATATGEDEIATESWSIALSLHPVAR